MKLILVRPLAFGTEYVLAKLIGGEVYDVLNDAEARALGLDNNHPRELDRAMTRLLHAARAGAGGAPWARPKDKQRDS